MSRCFPFPPPGYENKLGDHGELLAKEKHKEKKHKKEKKDKEKKEGKKDKKEKDRSKDKHKEKKDRKEKHKDKKKEKDRDKSKNRTSDEGRIEGQASAHNEGKLGDNSQKAEEIKDSKYMEELGRRIRDEEKGATIRMVDTTGSIQKGIENIGSEIAISNSIHRRAEGMEIGAAVNNAIKKRMDSMATGNTAIGGTGPKGFENMRTGNANINSLHRRPEIMGTDAAVSGSVKRRIENTGTGSAISGMQDPMESINTQTAAVFQKKTESKSTGTAISGSLQKRMDSKGIGIAISSSGPNRTQSMVDSMAMEKESTVSKLAPNLVGTEERKKNGMDKQVETDAAKRIEIDKERVTGNKMLTNLIRVENRKINGLGKKMESIMEKRSETNDKVKEREPGRHKEKNREEKKSKRKDKSRHKEKEKEMEKMREKGELGNKDKLKNTGKKDLVDNSSFKPAVPHIDTENNTVPDGTIKKRKDFETNGALHENDVRPHKLPRLASSSHLPVENGRTAELNHIIPPNSFMRQRAFNSVSVKAERALDIQDRKANGIKEAHTSEVEMKSLSTSAPANGEVYAKPHPDTKFLTKVYSVPKMDEWLEYDDQEWLFSNDNNQQKPRPKLEVEEIPQVWAEAVQIKSADVFAMPYVVPY